jgi:hydrogenase maturation protease
MATSKVRVIGCGSPDRGDDAVGLLAARMVRDDLVDGDGVDVVEAGPSVKVLDLLEGVGSAVVVDAVRTTTSAPEPGRIIRARVGPRGLPGDMGSFLSSHGIGLADVLGLAILLGRTRQLVFLGVEVQDVTAGSPLSEPVARALPSLVAAIRQEIHAMNEEQRL